MASPYTLDNNSLALMNLGGQAFTVFVAFLNPVAITTNWNDLNMDAQGNWLAPPNYDTCLNKVAPYAPIANFGGNRIGFVGEPLYFDGTRSSQRFDLPALIPSSLNWTFTGSPILTYYHGFSQVEAVWSTPGLYTVGLTVNGNNGAHTSGVRQVMIYPDRASAFSGVITLSGLSGSIASGGWQAQITTVNNQYTLIPPDQIPIGQYYPFVAIVETRYEVSAGVWQNATIGQNGQFLPSQPYSDPRILFDGYILNGSMYQDIDKDTLSFSLIGPQQILQEAKTHLLGYYNATNKTYSNGTGSFPTALNTSAAGQGFLVGGLMTTDVIQSILQTHTNIARYHDLHMWNPNIVTSVYEPNANPKTAAWYNIQYTTLSVNEGTVWQNLLDLTNNEWCQVYCNADGAICVGPQVNFQGQDYWNIPTYLGNTVVSYLFNYAADLGYTLPSTDTDLVGNMPTIAAQPIPIQLVHAFGTKTLPTSANPTDATNILFEHQQLNGPPLLCLLSDIPFLDTGYQPLSLPPNITLTWPQDLSIYPITMTFNENYTGRTSLVKLIGTFYGHSTSLTSWYPQNTFQVAGDGTSTIVTSVLPAGNWVVNEQHLLGDITTSINQQLVIDFFWEMARREYFAANMMYTGTVTLGMFTPARLSDIVAVTRQNNTEGPHWTKKPFYITQIDYALDFVNRTWTTTLGFSEATSNALGAVQPPPAKPPKFRF